MGKYTIYKMHKIHTQNLLNLSIDKKLRPLRAESERPRPGELVYANSRKLKKIGNRLRGYLLLTILRWQAESLKTLSAISLVAFFYVV